MYIVHNWGHIVVLLCVLLFSFCIFSIFLDQEDPLEKKMATHSSILAWKISWTDESGRLQSMGSQESDMT